jgi:hypothetical protein
MNNKACLSERILRKTGVVGRWNAYCIGLLLLFLLAATTPAQFTCKTNSGSTVTITGYSGSGGSIVPVWLSAADDAWAVARTSNQMADR